MTNENEIAIEDAPELEVTDADNESVETEAQEDDVSDAEAEGTETESEEVEFPKKAVNALNRKNKTINKLRAQMRELEAKLNDVSPQVSEQKELNPDDFETYGEYMDAKVEAMVEQRLTQSKSDMQKDQLTQQQESLKAQRDQYIIEQANEASLVLTDLPDVWQQNAQTLDSLPKEIEEIFYSIDNAPAAVYALAKEGRLESLMYAHPAVAAQEILNAQNKGLAMMSKPQKRVSQAPAPISKARGTGSFKKQLSPNDDVLKSLGLK